MGALHGFHSQQLEADLSRPGLNAGLVLPPLSIHKLKATCLNESEQAITPLDTQAESHLRQCNAAGNS
jgi:hypothetical protein